jgi:hypothetical protein
MHKLITRTEMMECKMRKATSNAFLRTKQNKQKNTVLHIQIYKIYLK